MNVLSLCDGMSCGMIALKKCGIKVDSYYASEIKDIAIKVSEANYPDIIRIGDVTKCRYSDGKLTDAYGNVHSVKFDLVMFGSPCQSFSICMKSKGRIGLADPVRSGLFYECHRLLVETDPKYFFVENVASMKDEDAAVLSGMLGVSPVTVDAGSFGPVHRKRLYWTNIPGIPQFPKEKTEFGSILESGYTPFTTGVAVLASECRLVMSCPKRFHRSYVKRLVNMIYRDRAHFDACLARYREAYDGKCAREIPKEDPVFDGIRVLSQRELERCHSVPEGYTACLSRNDAANVIGDGWHIGVICGFFRNLL